MTPTPYAIEQAVAAWQRTRSQLALDPDLANDEAAMTALLGPLEGDVRDILTRVVRAANHARSMADAAAEQIENMRARQERYKNRCERLRETALQIMTELGEKRFELPDLTVTLATGRASVQVTNADELPDEYVRIKREPDKSALLADLKHGVVIPGATLANGSIQLQIRGK